MKKTLILLAMVAALMILPFFINHGGEFGGSDGEAESQIRWWRRIINLVPAAI